MLRKFIIIFCLFPYVALVHAQVKDVRSCKELNAKIYVEYLHLREAETGLITESEFALLHDNWSSAYPAIGRLKIDPNEFRTVELEFENKKNEIFLKESFVLEKDGMTKMELRDFINSATKKLSSGILVFKLLKKDEVICQEKMQVTTIIDQ